MNRIKVKHLQTGRIRLVEMMLFYNRDTVDDPWYMFLETSLRHAERRDTKKKGN